MQLVCDTTVHTMSELSLMLCKWSNEFYHLEHSNIGLNYFHKIEIFWRVLFEGRCISLNKNGPIWAGVAAGDFAVSQKGLSKIFRFYGNNLAQCLHNNSKWSNLFDHLHSISAGSDLVWVVSPKKSKKNPYKEIVEMN